MQGLRVGALCIALMGVGSAGAAPRYQLDAVAPLGVPGAQLENIGAFNDRGQFAGRWKLDGRRAGSALFLYTPGVGYETLMPAGLPAQIGGDFGANDLNERGEVAALVNGHAYVLRAGGAGYLVPNTGDRYSGALGINDRGQVVGFREDPGGYRAFAYSPHEGFSTLPFRNSLAEGINNGGQVLVDDGGSEGQHYWIHDLSTGGSTRLPTDLNGSPIARINDHGDVALNVGPGDANRAMLFRDGVMNAIDGLAGTIDDEVLDFNNLGQVLGRSIRPNGGELSWDPFVYQPGEGSFRLQSLIDPANLAGWDWIVPSRLNDRGDIVGYGRQGGTLVPFMLRAIAAPVPEPAVPLMALAGLGCVAAGLRRRKSGDSTGGAAATAARERLVVA